MLGGYELNRLELGLRVGGGGGVMASPGAGLRALGQSLKFVPTQSICFIYRFSLIQEISRTICSS